MVSPFQSSVSAVLIEVRPSQASQCSVAAAVAPSSAVSVRFRLVATFDFALPSLRRLLALDHEKGPTRALVSFGPAGLEKLDWRGPWFLASARLEPLRKGTFRMQLGEEPVKLEFELGGERPFVRLGALKLERQ